MIDVDWIEYCRDCNETLMLLELQESAHEPKDAPVLAALATRTGVPCFSVSYRKDATGEIVGFRRRQENGPVRARTAWTETTAQYANWLSLVHSGHKCKVWQRRRTG